MPVTARSRLARGLALTAVATLALSACAAKEEGGGGGTLAITSFLAQTGEQASAAQPLIAAAQLAVDDINAAGGVRGEDVVYEAEDSTSDNDSAAGAADKVINSEADVVIGTYGSSMAAAVIPTITEAGLAMVSGSNTSSELTGISPLYFRTAPTDALEAAQLADLMGADGVTSVGIIWQNDAWGAAFEESMVTNLETAGIKVAANKSFNVDETDYSAQVNAVAATDPDAVVFLSYATYSGAMVEQLIGTKGFPADHVYFSSSTLGDYTKSVSDQSYLAGVQGFQPGADVDVEADFEKRLLEIDGSLSSFAYAASTYDATILTALASEVSGSTDGAEIGEVMAEISGSSGGGESCSTYADCLAIIDDGDSIDYDGLTGAIKLNDDNDVSTTNYIHYAYAEDGTYAPAD